MESSFGELKISLNEHLTREDCHRLCTIFNFPRGKQDAILRSDSRGLELLEFLTENKVILPGNVTKLWEALAKLKLNTAAAEVHEYALSVTEETNLVQEKAVIPPDNESDDESGGSDVQDGITFEDFLSDVGLRNFFPQGLELESFVKIKSSSFYKEEISMTELFWQKLSSLDYRVRSSHFLKLLGKRKITKFSVRDFVFAVLHCSDSFLRQDIIEKLSSCHLAVPIVLQGVNGSKPEFLLWSFRRIVKKWRDSNSVALEQQIFHIPIFTVSFMRISDVNDVSQSSIMNRLLGAFQGNDPHPFFLTNNDDTADSRFSKGCVEGVWYLPVKTNGSEKNKQWGQSLFLNLRGDCTQFPEQARFVYEASQLTVVLIADRNRKKFSTFCKEVMDNAKTYLFIIVKDDQHSVPPKRKKVKLDGNYMYVRSTNIDDVFEQLSCFISHHQVKCDPKAFTSLGRLEKLCRENIDVEENKEEFRKAKELAKEITKELDATNISVYKRSTFKLQEKWLKWVAIDRERHRNSNLKEESVEFFRSDVQRRKEAARRDQLNDGLSDTMQYFHKVLREVHGNTKSLRYFSSYLRDELCLLVDDATKTHLQNIKQFEESIKDLDKVLKSKSSSSSEAITRWQKKRAELKCLLTEENDRCRGKNIGWEHFIRELGQWYEARSEVSEAKPNADVMSLSEIAVHLLLNGQLLEIMDGDTGSVALSWITSVLDTLTQKLNDPKILVLCVVGAQSSGKSTFLNSMFGVKFPIRAGRCTRGMVLRILKVEESQAEELGFEYLFLVDSEGLRSIERNNAEEYRFDNELVTLALCISDVTVLNIEGEHIGPETTGFLGIAAHALIRMKEIDIQSQCRIVQQKVSDTTAHERNKTTMNQILNSLDTATREAAKEEGYINKYKEFSDIFELKLDENLQFVPSLWTCSTSPPCQFYSEIVSKIKLSILEEARSQSTSQHFTVSTFTQRMRDVWRAIKEENFVLNFQDSVKAVDYNSMCMELNKLVTNMRFEMMKNLNVWQTRIKSCGDSLISTFDSIKEECKNELQAQKCSMTSSLHSYVAQHKRERNLAKHLPFIERNLDFTISDTEKDLVAVINNDVTTRKIQNYIPAAVVNMRKKLRQDAKREAERLRNLNQTPSSNYVGHQTAEEFFCAKWDEWKTERARDFQVSRASGRKLEQHCESLLLAITEDTSVSKEIHRLAKEEGGPVRHVSNIEWRKYFPKTSIENAEMWLKQNENALESILSNCMEELDENLSHKSFDANLFQFELQNAFQRCSVPNVTSEPPGAMKAKFLLHVCGKLLDIAIKHQKQFEDEHSFDKLFEKERESLRKDFFSFLKDKNQVGQAVECIRRFLTAWTSDVVKTYIKSMFPIMLSQEGLLDPRSRDVLMLNELKQKNNFKEYFKYWEAYFEYHKAWFFETLINIYKQTEGGKTCLQLQVEECIASIKPTLCEIVSMVTKKASEDTISPSNNDLFRHWVNLFVQELLKANFPKCQELASELYTYNISELSQFECELLRVLSTTWMGDIIKGVGIEQDNLRSVTGFVKRELLNEFNTALHMTCKEQCPLCRAPCENRIPPGPTHEHFSHTHLPRGISGAKDPKTSRLLIDNCVTSVLSPTATFLYPGDPTPRLCSDYKKYFPKWRIERGFTWEGAANLAPYWHSVMAAFNKELATHYKCLEANIPHSWNIVCPQLSFVFQTNTRISVTMNESVTRKE